MKTKMKKLLLISLLCFLGKVNAQQLGTYSNYIMNDFYYNPAIAGSKNVHMLNLAYRNSWIGFEGAPASFSLNLTGSYKNKGKAGYGATLINEKSGLLAKTGVYGNYAQHIKLSKKVKLGVGFQIGYLQYNVRLYDAILADKNDVLLSSTGTLAQKALDINAGLNLYSERFFFRAAASQLVGRNLKFTSLNNSLVMQYTSTIGYTFSTKNKKMEFQPSVMARYVKPLPISIAAMLKFSYNKKFWIAGIFRADDAFGAALGFIFKERVTVAYCFDYQYKGLKSFQSGSHEIGLSFVLTKPKPNLDKEDDDLNKSILDELKKREEEQN
jgi:type IX secretion system PorP/SprF family membrane protein